MNRLARRLKLAFYDLIPYPSKRRKPDEKIKKSDYNSSGKGNSNYKGIFKGPRK